MSKEVRSVSPNVKPRCPECRCFVRLDAVACNACGSALVAGTRRAETQRLFVEAQGEAFQNGPTVSPSGNAHPQSFQFKNSDFSNLQPNGKIKKTRKPKKDFQQLSFFHEDTDSHGPCSFDFSEVLG
jgi:hypothetical protein